MNEFFFGVYPYICLVILCLGLLARFLATPQEWNARSSNLFAKNLLVIGSFIFHYAIICAFFGHLFGLLTPTSIFNAIGFTTRVHTAVASFFGAIFAPAVLVGLGILLYRRVYNRNVWASTVVMDLVVICIILIQAFTGGWQDIITRTDVIAIVGPWIKGVLACHPDPALMAQAPCAIKVHVVFGFTLFAMIPFSRLIHFFSAPIFWFFRPLISYRRRYENL